MIHITAVCPCKFDGFLQKRLGPTTTFIVQLGMLAAQAGRGARDLAVLACLV